MAKQSAPPAASISASQRFFPWLPLLFVGSGCAALIYEIVWLQLLQLVIGSTAVSLAVLLATFMGGMCLGSLALPRLVSARHHPLRVYALLELGTAIIGILVLLGMPYVDRLYALGAGHGLLSMALRGVVSAVCLLPPTALMGATLPAMARCIETTPQGVSRLGLFYGGNIAGAMFGCLLAGFYLLRVYDAATATCVAAAINVAAALIVLGMAGLAPYHAPAGGPKPPPAGQADGSRAVYVAIGLSGLCALGGEVVWTRLLSLMFGPTVYTFSIILAAFLLGLGVGSGVGALLARTTPRPRFALGCCQVLLTAAIAWAAYLISDWLPFWPIVPKLARDPWMIFEIDLLRCMLAVLPAACLWGASFPLALAAIARRDEDAGRLVGNVYAANTAGAIVGAAAFSMLLIPVAGSRHAQRLLIVLSALAAVLMFVRRPLPRPAKASAGSPPERHLAGAAALAAGLAVVLMWSVPEVPWGVIAFGRFLPTAVGQSKLDYGGEGINDSIAVTEKPDGVRSFHVSGKVEASNDREDMRLQRLLGHLPAVLHAGPRRVLVVGCGTGATAGSFVTYPGVERIVVCEIEPLVPRVAAGFFGHENCGVFDDPRVEVVYDDGRHYLRSTPETFDIITSDPIHPWVKGSAALYSREYFELCRRHLNPGGVITQWVPLYETNEDSVKSELATFFSVFPQGTIWSSAEEGKGLDLILSGRSEASKINVDELQERLDRKDHAAVRQSLQEVGLGSAVDLLATYAGQASELAPWLRNAQINRDWNLRLQYLAGMGRDSAPGGRIYNDVMIYRTFPAELFLASPPREQALRQALKK